MITYLLTYLLTYKLLQNTVLKFRNFHKITWFVQKPLKLLKISYGPSLLGVVEKKRIEQWLGGRKDEWMDEWMNESMNWQSMNAYNYSSTNGLDSSFCVQVPALADS